MALEMATPLAYHRWLNVGVGLHVPRDTVSLFPTFAVPMILGVAAFRVPATTAPVWAEARDAVTYPARAPWTRTLILLPSCAAVSLNVAAVAPATGDPLASHWYEKPGVGDQAPLAAVSVE
ncbi:MAG: hypothetical protein EON52_02180, partial [Actinomycetales bacterium]